MLKKYPIAILITSLLICLMCTTLMTTNSELWSEQLLYIQTIIAIGGLISTIAIIFTKDRPCITVVDATMALWLIYVILRTYFDGNHSSNAFRPIIGYTTLASLYAIIRLLPKQSIPTGKLIVLTLLATTTYELILGIWQMCSGTSHHQLYLATGSMFNPGPYSAYLAIGMTLAISLLHEANELDWRRPYHGALLWACVAIVVIGCFVVTITRSRSAVIAVALATAWIFRKEMKRKYIIPIIIVSMLAICALIYIKFGSAMGRIIIWEQALYMIAEKPFFGYGIGSFSGEYGRHLSTFFTDSSHIETLSRYADVADYAFCDLLQVFAEQGIIGGVLCLTFTILSLIALNRQSPHLAVSFATLILFSLFSYPMQLLPLQTICICLAAYSQIHRGGFIIGRHHAVTLTLICMIVIVTCRNISRQRYDAQVEYHPIKGITNTAFIEDYNRLLPLCNDNKQFLFDFARLLQADNRHFDACAILRRGVAVSGDPMFWVLMGNSQNSLNRYNEAIACYDYAYSVLPNRLYPLYRKMILQKEKGDITNARQTARMILKTTPKVRSSATRRMTKEAKDLL